MTEKMKENHKVLFEDGPQKLNAKIAHKTGTFDRPKSLQNKKIIALIRNGERIDRVFPEWLNLNFTDSEEYLPTDLNQPIEMLKRSGGIEDYIDDSPITEIGDLTSECLGRSFGLHGIWPLQKVYSSPSLRCIQSAAAFIKGLNKNMKLCVEPGLFDWTKWYKKIPKFLSIDELVKAGYSIDTEYIPFKKVDELEEIIGQETIDEFYSRIRACISAITSTSTSKPERIAIITHSTSIDASIKALRKCPPRLITETNMTQMGMHYPYSTTVMLAKDHHNWSFVYQPIAPFSYLGISNKPDVKFINLTTRAKVNLKFEA
uniref:Uncharacterized protein n=1 Tax=Panagrolaimus davidi TaxID=227884 RepID=A0A914QEA8_9BILA